MNPVRRHGKFMKNRAEKAGGYVKEKRKIVVGILAALLCTDNRRVWIFFGTGWKSKIISRWEDIRINMTEFAR